MDLRFLVSVKAGTSWARKVYFKICWLVLTNGRCWHLGIVCHIREIDHLSMGQGCNLEKLAEGTDVSHRGFGSDLFLQTISRVRGRVLSR